MRKFITPLAFGLGVFLLSGFGVAIAQEIPNYTSGSVFFVGDVPLSDASIAEIETEISNYEIETGNQIGVFLVEDYRGFASSWRNFLNLLTDSGYAPGGWLIVLDFESKQIYLAYDNALEYAGIWQSEDTDKIVEEILPYYLQTGQTDAAILESIAYIAEKVPDSLPVFEQEKTEKEITKTKVKGFISRQALLFSLGALALLVGGFGGTLGVNSWRKKRYIARVETFFNDVMPIFRQDLKGLKNTVKDASLLGIIADYEKDLEEVKTKLISYFEEADKPVKESREYANLTEKLEDEITYLINNASDAEGKIVALRAMKDEVEKEMAETFNRVNL